MSIDDDIWYAVNQTKILVEPKQVLETFGVTRVHYYLISELMDEVGKFRIREGIVLSEQPQIITPGSYAKELLNGFDKKAHEYAEWLLQNTEMIKILQYGLQIKKEESKNEIVYGSFDTVISKIKETAEKNSSILSTVILGVDKMWEISLMKFINGFIQISASKNIQDIQRHELDFNKAMAKQRFDEIEEEFYNARGKKQKLYDLGSKLRDMGVFQKFEDRFYALLREVN